jgi:hypothetical protein
MNFFRSIRERVFKPIVRGTKIYEIEYTVYHDSNVVTRFKLNLKANSKPHAWAILSKYVEIKPTDITLKK